MKRVVLGADDPVGDHSGRRGATTPLVVVVCGAHSTGKTTLCHDLADTICARPRTVHVVEGVARSVGRAGLPLGQACTADTYCAITAAHLNNVSQLPAVDVCLLDRYVLDIHAYARANGNISAHFDNLMSGLYAHCMTPIDEVFYIPNELPLIPDGVRDESLVFREHVDEALRQILEAHVAQYTEISGGRAERVAAGMRIIDARLADR